MYEAGLHPPASASQMLSSGPLLPSWLGLKVLPNARLVHTQVHDSVRKSELRSEKMFLGYFFDNLLISIII